MYGTIIGDMVGAPYEFDKSSKTKDFVLFNKKVHYTDDSVMTVAVAEALLKSEGKSDAEVKRELVVSMQKWGHKYPHAGYGGMFYRWLKDRNPKPYWSFGNGSAMRVSAAGRLYDTLEDTRRYARLSAEVTHNHPEGIKGAEAVASVIFLARKGASKNEIRDFVTREFGYDLSRTCDEIRPGYHFNETCQGTVPEAITAFLEGESFEDVIRTAVSLGGDCDTLTCIAGGMAEAYYGIPEEMLFECRKRLPDDMLEVLDRFYGTLRKEEENVLNTFLEGNEVIEKAIENYYTDSNNETLTDVLSAIRTRMHADGHFLLPIERADDEGGFFIRSIQTGENELYQAAFTSEEEYRKGEACELISNFMDVTLNACLSSDSQGIILNPWGQAFLLQKELIESIFKADEGVAYSVPDTKITQELLEGGMFLKKAVEICRRNITKLNLIKLFRILHESFVWIPCNAILSEADYDQLAKAAEEAKEDPDSLIGQTFMVQDNIRFVPDILQRDEDYFFPVFTSEEEMGEYGEGFSKMEKSFLEAMILAGSNEKNVKGIVINAFSEPFEIPCEMFDIIEGVENAEEGTEAGDE